MKSIRNLIAEEATIMCNGEWPTIPSVDIVSFFSSTIYYYTQINSKGNVPGDIWIVEASSNLHFDRSLLTGERLVISPYFYFCFFALLYSHLLQDQVI
jgi:magnesium-transporting ATPase (P-type)